MVPDTIFCNRPLRTYSESLILINVCAHVSVRVREQARRTRGERGFVMELGVTEFSGLHNPNHLTLKRKPE